MLGLDKSFQIQFADLNLLIETIEIPKQVLFRVTFPDKRLPLTIGRVYNFNHEKFWTSIPEGRLKEAQQIGPLIEAWYRANK